MRSLLNTVGAAVLRHHGEHTVTRLGLVGPIAAVRVDTWDAKGRHNRRHVTQPEPGGMNVAEPRGGVWAVDLRIGRPWASARGTRGRK